MSSNFVSFFHSASVRKSVQDLCRDDGDGGSPEHRAGVVVQDGAEQGGAVGRPGQRHVTAVENRAVIVVKVKSRFARLSANALQSEIIISTVP